MPSVKAGRGTSPRPTAALLLLAVLLTGCAPGATVDHFRRDLMAQMLIKQAEDLADAGQPEGRAVQLAVWARKLAPDNLPVLRTATRIFLSGRAWDQGLEALSTLNRKTGAMDPYNLGVCYLNLGQEAKGVALLEADLGAERSLYAAHRVGQETMAGALNNVGYVYADVGVRLDEALALTKEAVDLEPANGTFLDSLGWAYCRVGQYDSAAFAMEQALRQFRTPEPDLFYHAGVVHARQGRLQLARLELRRALSLSGGDFPEAADALQRMRWQLPPPQKA